MLLEPLLGLPFLLLGIVEWVHIVKDKVSHGLHKYLTKDELHAIETARMGTESLDRVRDLFVFQACTCLSYKDLASFDVRKVREEHGRMMYTGKRGKTGGSSLSCF